MIVCPIPSDEAVRLQALHALEILDTPPELRFELIVKYIAELLSVPIALITLIDSNRQWFKAKQGVDVSEISRDISVCAHAICEVKSMHPAERVYEIHDLRADVRFVENPQVVSDPNARSYISYVLQSECGRNIGTLCLVDTRVRVFADSEKEVLIGVGRIIDNLINEC